MTPHRPPRSRRPELLRLGLDWCKSPGDLLGSDPPAHWFSVLVARFFKDQPQDLAAWLEEVHGADDRIYGMWPLRNGGWLVHSDLGARCLVDANDVKFVYSVEVDQSHRLKP